MCISHVQTVRETRCTRNICVELRGYIFNFPEGDIGDDCQDEIVYRGEKNRTCSIPATPGKRGPQQISIISEVYLRVVDNEVLCRVHDGIDRVS